MALPSDLILSIWARLPLQIVTTLPLSAAQFAARNRFRGLATVATIEYLTPYETQLKAAILSGEAAYEAQMFTPAALLNSIRDSSALPILADQICRDAEKDVDSGYGVLAALSAQNYHALAWLLPFIKYNLYDLDLGVFLRAGDFVLTPALAKFWRAYQKMPGVHPSSLLSGAFEVNKNNNAGYATGWLFTHEDLPPTTPEGIRAIALAFHNRGPIPLEYEITALKLFAYAALSLGASRDFPQSFMSDMRAFDPATMQKRAGPMHARVLAQYEPSTARERYLALLDFILDPSAASARTVVPLDFALMLGRVDLARVIFSFENYEVNYSPLVLFRYCLNFVELLRYFRDINVIKGDKMRNMLLSAALLRGHGLEFLDTISPLEYFRNAQTPKNLVNNSFLLQYLFTGISDVKKLDNAFEFHYVDDYHTLKHEIPNSYVADTWRVFGTNINVTNEVFNQRLAAVQTLLNALLS